MAPASIHQAIHGYRDGHRLLSSSTQLSADATRAILVLSDMSGPSMQSGFDEYLTGYPLLGSEYFVFAKTWYATEMQRPGCVWTHSLLIPRSQVSHVTTDCLREHFQRPQLDCVEQAAAAQIVIADEESGGLCGDGFGDRTVAAAVVGAVLGQPRPVIVAVDTAAQLEGVVLRLWDELWPAEKARFSFCTGALMPRSNAGALLDLQAVPRAIPTSQFRKSASAALVLDLRAPNKSEAWVDFVLDGATRADASFQTWLEDAAGSDADRCVVSSLVPIFGEWHIPGSSARSVLASVVNAKDLDSSTRSRLVGMAFTRAGTEAGAIRERELLQDLCRHRVADLTPIVQMLESQTRRLFDESREEGVALVLSLLGGDLTDVGERVLRVAVLSLVPGDLETFGDAQASLLPTIVGANPVLASSPALWRRVGARSAEVLVQLSTVNLSDDDRGGVVDAFLTSGRDIPIEALLRFGGKVAISRCLSALAAGQLEFSWQWRSLLSVQPDTILAWLESHPSLSPRELELGSRFLSPKAYPSRLVKIWQRGTASCAGTFSPRIASFGLALALLEGDSRSPLLAACFQLTYDAFASSRVEYDEWDWLREYAPAVSWWRDWDKCERLAAALARRIEKDGAPLETVFNILKSRSAIRKVVLVLDDDKDTRPYLKALRKSLEASPGVGNREQHDALLEGW